MTPCSFCQKLSETKKVTVTYHKCDGCNVEDYTVQKAGQPIPMQPSAPQGLPMAPGLRPGQMPGIPGITSDPTKPPAELMLG